MTQVLPGYSLDSRFAARVMLARGLWDSRRSSKSFKPLVDPVVAARRYPVPQERFLDKLKTRCTAHKALPVHQSQAVHDKNTRFRLHLVIFIYICLTFITEHKIHHLYSLITTHDDFGSANPSSMQDACQIWTQLKCCSPWLLVAQWIERPPVFRRSWVCNLCYLSMFRLVTFIKQLLDQPCVCFLKLFIAIVHPRKSFDTHPLQI